MPSLDLHEGEVVKLTGGKLETRRVVAQDPEALAHFWRGQGARWLHVVDLNAAFGDGSNTAVIRKLMQNPPRWQVSGGLGDERELQTMLEAGADRVIVGTKAILDPEWLQACAKRFRKKLWVAVDSRGDQITVKGWTTSAKLTLAEYLREVDNWPFGGYLYTNVSVEGRQKGIDRQAVRRMVSLTRKPVCYSGGVTSPADIKLCRDEGVHAIIVGAAFYFGGMTFAEASEAASRK